MSVNRYRLRTFAAGATALVACTHHDRGPSRPIFTSPRPRMGRHPAGNRSGCGFVCGRTGVGGPTAAPGGVQPPSTAANLGRGRLGPATAAPGWPAGGRVPEATGPGCGRSRSTSRALAGAGSLVGPGRRRGPACAHAHPAGRLAASATGRGRTGDLGAGARLRRDHGSPAPAPAVRRALSAAAPGARALGGGHCVRHTHAPPAGVAAAGDFARPAAGK